MRQIVFATLCGYLISAEGAERTLPIRNAGSTQAHQEIATAVRSILELPSLTVDTESHQVTAGGSDSQITAAEWVLSEIDRPPRASGAKPWASAVYRGPATPGEVLRVFYVQGGTPVPQLQEAATVIRSLVELRRLFTYNQAGAIVARGTPEQIEAAEWVWRILETNPPFAATEEFRAKLPDGQSALRAYRFPADWSVQSLQEAATMMRSIVEIRRMYTYNPSRTVVVRADEDEVAAATWMAVEAQRPPSPDLAESAPFEMADPRGEGSIRVFRLPATRFDVRRLQQLATEVRTATNIRRAFTFNPPRMLVLRGPAGQLETARQMIAEAR
jgi:hypothetical protein